MNRDELLKKLPQINAVLSHDSLTDYSSMYRDILLKSTRSVIEQLREKILKGENVTDKDISIDNIIDDVVKKIKHEDQYRLKRLINCTGIILHTNLGRAKLSRRAIENVLNVASGYSNLEYDLKTGQRGSRHDHLEKLLTDLLSVESVMIVNNNAAATMFCLASLAKGKKTVVSRGELVEIGGSFRIPDIMERSGSILCEVGTTNKTNIQDYINAIDDETAVILKVHTSNYRIVGFTAESTISELSEVSKDFKIPLVHDLGSGLINSMMEYGIDEISIKETLEDGTDVVLFSGDKMLGGPQCGIIAGKKEYISKMKKNPLARVVRVDKMTLAALEGTIRDYIYYQDISNVNPTLDMISVSKKNLERKAIELKDQILQKTNSFKAEIVTCTSRIGGGTAPLIALDSYAVCLEHEVYKTQKMERMMRKNKIPVIVRIKEDKVILDIRTVEEEEFSIIVDALKWIESEGINDE